MNKIFLDNLPRINKHGANFGAINWKKSIGIKCIRVIYNDAEYFVDIVDYQSPYLYISYEGNIFKIANYSFCNCKLGKLFNSMKFKYNVGDIISDEDRKLEITYAIRKKDNDGSFRKYYKYKCLDCGFDCNTLYYRNGIAETEFYVRESNLYNHKCKCACCSSKITISEINSISVTRKEMAKYFKDINDCRKYTAMSNKKVNVICPECKNEKTMAIDSLCKNGIMCSCGDGTSFGEKVIINIFRQLNIEYIHQLSKKHFHWLSKYRYDFYFENNNNRYIIEIHGEQHPGTKYHKSTFESCGGRTYDEELTNDTLKKKLAERNDINYIVIDCSLSDIFFIKNEITNSKLNSLFDINLINWNECSKFAYCNLVKQVCDYYNNSNETLPCIAKKFNIGKTTIYRYIKKGKALGWCK